MLCDKNIINKKKTQNNKKERYRYYAGKLSLETDEDEYRRRFTDS